MAWRPHGRAAVNPSNPKAWAICDRCQFTYNHVNLKWQYDWQGSRMMDQRLLVCDRCYDTPQTQLRIIVLPNDPPPIENPRPQRYTVI